jgi:hypothetical protein
MASANLLMTLLTFEAVFITLFSMFSVNAGCKLGFTSAQAIYSAPSPSGVETAGATWLDVIYGVLVGIGRTIVMIINAFVVFGQVITGLGMGCGFPTWFVTVFQIPILITIIYLVIPFVK